MERFVLLRHTMPTGSERADHWDLMLESDGLLRTWELLELPAAWSEALGGEIDEGTSASVGARELADHRLDYLDYEGPVSGGRGAVQRCDGGRLRWIEADETSATLELEGSKLRGLLRLALSRDESWQLSLA